MLDCKHGLSIVHFITNTEYVMKITLIVLTAVLFATFVGCSSSATVQADKESLEFEAFGFDGVQETENFWAVTGIGESRDLSLATMEAAMTARTELINFLAKPTVTTKTGKNGGEVRTEKREYTLSGSMVVRQRMKRTDSGGWLVKAIVMAPKTANPKEGQ